MKLRLLVTKECNRHCIGCCNDQYDLDTLPIETDFSHYDEIILTGGEPMLVPLTTLLTIKAIRNQTLLTPIYLYTADIGSYIIALGLLFMTDGMTVTVHNRHDILQFNNFTEFLLSGLPSGKSLRLNIIEGVSTKSLHPSASIVWDTKIKPWISNCPLPEGEVLKRIQW